MRKFLVFLLGGSMLILTSCIDMVEELYLNKDGSGKYIMKFDMSGMFSNPFMMGMMEETMKKELKLDENENLEKDSIMYYKDLPGAARLSPDEKAMLGNANIHMQMSQEKKQMVASTELAFKSFEELEKIRTLIKKISEEDGQGGLTGGSSPFASDAIFKLDKRTLTRMPNVQESDLFEGEQMDMVKMFLEGATMTSIYHLPGKVKKTTIKDAKVEGKTVTVIADLLDLVDKKTTLDGNILFKKR
ncbi:MAG: hypothetical protein DHS20C18_44240 [Saprospiraceae bacterium]|nr:MAG: hypothetical protein DHS20C18_44240 [Saprospiraceae bacterium]